MSMKARKITVALNDGTELSGIARLQHELNQSRINRARGYRGEEYATESAAVLAWCVVTNNGTIETAPTLDEWLSLEASPVVRLIPEEVDADEEEALNSLGKSTPTDR